MAESVAADIAAVAIWMRNRAAAGIVIDELAANFLAEALDETAAQVRALEEEARQSRRRAHVAATIVSLRRAAAIRQAGNVVDLTAILAREHAAKGDAS